MKAFVTVGTTEFEKLIETINQEETMELFHQLGITEMTVQYGHGKTIPEGKCGIHMTSFTTKPSILDEFEKADLIITHAGAGSVRESLQMRKPTIVVINDTLMHNHQTEMAQKLSELQAVTYCPSPSELKNVLKSFTITPGKDVILKGEKHEKMMNELMREWCEIEPNETEKKKEICVVLGSGGHTMEMMHVLTPFDREYHNTISKIDVIVAESDTISPKKMDNIHSEKTFHKIPRSRKVGQSYFTSIFTT